MKRLLSCVLGLTLSIFALLPARALDQASVPPKFPIPWGASAGSAYIRSIPITSQIGIQNCAASLTDGFPPLTFVPGAGGGCPPFGQDFNGVLRQLSQWSLWLAAGSPTIYDSSFQSSIAGYPKGAVLSSAATPGCFWLSNVDANTTNPETGGANWVGYCLGTSGSGVAASTGSANAQVVTTKPFTLQAGSSVTFVAGFTNTSTMQVNVNGAGLTTLYRLTAQYGATPSVGGEVVNGQLVTIGYDGAKWQCTSCGVAVVGEMKDFSNGAVPPGYGVANGTCVSQTTYADLFASNGSVDAWGPGSTGGACPAGQFHLPFANGRASVAYDTQGGVTGNVLNSGGGCNAVTFGVLCGVQGRNITTNYLPASPLTVSGNTSGYQPSSSGGFPAVAPANNSSVVNITFSGMQSIFASNQFSLISGFSSLTVNGATSNMGLGQTLPTEPPVFTVVKAVKF